MATDEWGDETDMNLNFSLTRERCGDLDLPGPVVSVSYDPAGPAPGLINMRRAQLGLISPGAAAAVRV